jgi:hypothetical protein
MASSFAPTPTAAPQAPGLPQPIAGQTLDWSPQGPGSPWESASDPLNAALSIGYDPSTGQWDESNASLGVGDEQSGLNPTSFTSAQADFNQLNPQPNQNLVNALAQPAYLPTPTLQAPTYATPAANITGSQLSTSNVDPALLSALSPAAAEQLTMQGAAPGIQQQDNLLQQQLADAGIVGGPSTTAGDQLAQSQAAGFAPSLASEVTNSQNNLLSAANTGTANTQNAALANQGVQQNTNLTNAGIANTSNAGNVNTINATNQANTGTYNAQIAALMALLNGQSTTQAGQYGGVTSNQQTGASNIAQTGANAYGVPTNTGGANSLASGIASYNPVTSQSTAAASPYTDTSPVPASTAAAATDYGLVT